MDEIFEKRELIMEYIDEEECIHMCTNRLYDCYICDHLEECYENAEIEQNDEMNYVYAEAVNYGGYESAENFWSDLLE